MEKKSKVVGFRPPRVKPSIPNRAPSTARDRSLKEFVPGFSEQLFFPKIRSHSFEEEEREGGEGGGRGGEKK